MPFCTLMSMDVTSDLVRMKPDLMLARARSMQAGQMPAALQAELEAFRRWCTARFYGQQQEPIAEVTAAKYLDHIRYGPARLRVNEERRLTSSLQRLKPPYDSTESSCTSHAP